MCVQDDPWEVEVFRHVAVDLLALDVEVVGVTFGDALSILTASAATGFYPHLLVLDCHLQVRGGLEFLEELHCRDLPQVPVVFVTPARTDAATRRKAAKYGALECFYTAISFDDVVVAVSQVCAYAKGEAMMFTSFFRY